MNIRNLWTNAGIFYFANRGSTPIGIRSRITVPSNRTIPETAAIIELAARIGLHTVELSTPLFEQLFVFDELDPNPMDKESEFNIVLGFDSEWLYRIFGERIAPCMKALQSNRETGILFVDENFLVISGTSPEMTLHAARYLTSDGFLLEEQEEAEYLLVPSTINPITSSTGPSHTKKSTYSLHNLFTREGLFELREGEIHPTLDVLFSINKADDEITVATVELAARLAMEAGYVCFPVSACTEEEYAASRFSIQFESDNGMEHDAKFELTEIKGSPSLRVSCTSNRLIQTAREMMELWFTPLDHLAMDTWRHRLTALKSPSPDISVRAQLAMMAHHLSKNQHRGSNFVIPGHRAEPVQLWRQYLSDGAGGEQTQIITEEEKPIWTANWEDPGEIVDIEVFVLTAISHMNEMGSLPPELKLEVTTTVSEDTFRSWAEQTQRDIYQKWSVHATFIYRDANKSGLHWAMQEVLPHLRKQKGIYSVDIQARACTPKDRHLDLIHRFLQELYPLDAILSVELKLPLEQIQLGLIDEEDAPMFSIVARNEQGETLGSWSWTGWVESLPYMPDQPNLGHVMIPFAGCRIYGADQNDVLASKSFFTNPYRFWVWYQELVLPTITAQIGDSPGVLKFSRLECHVSMDAKDNKIPYLEEVSSVLEALHEDIYFYTLHALHQHGKKTGDPGWDAPGGILPYMHEAVGANPSALIELYELPKDHQIKFIHTNGAIESIQPIGKDKMNLITITSLTRQNNQTYIELDGFSDTSIEVRCAEWLSGASGGIFSEGQESRTENRNEKSLDSDVFINEDVKYWLEKRGEELPGQFSAIDSSLEGRPIWFVELYERAHGTGGVSSILKHSLYKPTFFLNARHHANEVTSTNSSLALIEQIIQQPEILNLLNLVVVPLENVDGSAIHDKMAQEHPYWKLHAARYNACGVEFAKHRFEKDVPFGESRVYPKIWDRWSPDIVLDDHGVPSHEWIQPFSGYSSPPRFPVSYWIPSARMYTIWRELTDEPSQAARDAYLSLRSAVTGNLQKDELTAKDNSEWLNVYSRWGNAFDEKHFPIELSNGSIAYTRNCRKDTNSHDLIERFGEWVTADLMTEVNDETVYEKELSSCKHAHQVVYEAIVDWMSKRTIKVNVKRTKLENGSTRIGLERVRPL